MFLEIGVQTTLKIFAVLSDLLFSVWPRAINLTEHEVIFSLWTWPPLKHIETISVSLLLHKRLLIFTFSFSFHVYSYLYFKTNPASAFFLSLGLEIKSKALDMLDKHTVLELNLKPSLFLLSAKLCSHIYTFMHYCRDWDINSALYSFDIIISIPVYLYSCQLCITRKAYLR